MSVEVLVDTNVLVYSFDTESSTSASVPGR